MIVVPLLAFGVLVLFFLLVNVSELRTENRKLWREIGALNIRANQCQDLAHDLYMIERTARIAYQRTQPGNY